MRLTFIVIFFMSFLVSAENTMIKKVEPANWWVDMKQQKLQILLYGENIGDLTAEINHKSVSIMNLSRVENSNYLFLYLNISEKTKPGNIEINLKRKNKLIKTLQYPLLPREQGSEQRIGFNSSDVMYLITPDRFVNGSTKNDNIEGMLETANRTHKGGRHGGDIEGVRQSLDYISDLGFTAIWLNPVLENDMKSSSYHGYAATDLYKIDARFGSNEEYKAFIKAANDKGIKVIMDMILNHVGSEHWFVKDSPTKDWINGDKIFTPTSHRRNTIQDLYASEYDKKQFSDGWFVKTMPDLNQRNDLLADYLIQNTIWWIEYSGLTGIRMDTYPYPDKDFMSRWTCEVMQEYPNFNIVGEEWTTDPAIVSYWQTGKVNHDNYQSCLPSLMDFPIQDALVKGLNSEEQHYGNGLIETYEMLTRDFLYAHPEELVIFPDNHDMDRFFTQVNEDIDLFHMGINYMATMRGTPQLYYGTEILMTNTQAKGDHGIIRTDFPGGWPNDKINAFTGEGLTKLQRQAKQKIKHVLNWRKNKKVIHQGKLMQFTPENGVYVYFRYDDTEKVMVVMNKNTKPQKLNLTRFSEMLSNNKSAKDIVTGAVHNLDELLPLSAKTTHIFELK